MKHIGWIIVDKDGHTFEFYAIEYPFYGATLKRERSDVDELLPFLSRDWAGLIPFTVKEVFTND